MRADVFLATFGITESRQKAQGLIKSGIVYINAKCVDKPSYEINDDTPASAVEIRGEGLPYVSRGGLKLHAALRSFNISPAKMTVLDAGASTGGFTDCLLIHGAKTVYAIDSGRGQLHPRLCRDKRVISYEKTDIRAIPSLGIYFDMAVMDLSFISQRLAYPAVSTVIKDGAPFISLYKPQFEVGREHIGKGGIVRDTDAVYSAALGLISAARGEALYCNGFIPSPIQGGDGNEEYLFLFRKNRNETLTEEMIKKVVFR